MGKSKHFNLLLFNTLSLYACGESVNDFYIGRELIAKAKYQVGHDKIDVYLAANPHGKHASRDDELVKKNFLDVIGAFPKSPEAHKAWYKVVLIDYVEGRTESAFEAVKQLIDKLNCALVPEARLMVRNLQYRVIK